VRIVAQLKETYPDVMVTMVGPDKDGSKFRVEQLAAELNVKDQVHLTGKLSKESWIELASEHDIFINTTNFDNMPVSVVEAMALGLPVITTDVGGIPFLIENNKDGLLVSANDLNGFCNMIQKLLKDASLVSSIATAAKTKVQEFDESIVSPKWKQLLS
jgi:glycosyltransferase involved in cell wall biosynthesis